MDGLMQEIPVGGRPERARLQVAGVCRCRGRCRRALLIWHKEAPSGFVCARPQGDGGRKLAECIKLPFVSFSNGVAACALAPGILSSRNVSLLGPARQGRLFVVPVACVLADLCSSASAR